MIIIDCRSELRSSALSARLKASGANQRKMLLMVCTKMYILTCPEFLHIYSTKLNTMPKIFSASLVTFSFVSIEDESNTLKVKSPVPRKHGRSKTGLVEEEEMDFDGGLCGLSGAEVDQILDNAESIIEDAQEVLEGLLTQDDGKH